MIQASLRKFAVLLPPLLAALGLALVSACGSGNTAPRTLPTREELAERPVAMRGAESYFDGQIGAVVTVSQGVNGVEFQTGLIGGVLFADDDINPDGTPKLQEVFKKELNDLEKNRLSDIISKMEGLRAPGSPLPPVLIQLQLTNTTEQPVQVRIREFKSYLGNFAVQPDLVTIPANTAMLVEPMTSRLGVTSSDIPVSLTLVVDGQAQSAEMMVSSVIGGSTGF